MEALTKLGRIGLPQLMHEAVANASSNGTVTLPPGILDTLLASAAQASPPMQLLMFVYRLLDSKFGLDPSVLLALLGFVWGVSKVLNQVYGMLESLINRYLMSSMYISEDDHIYMQLMKFLSEKKSIANNRSLMAQTVWRSAWEEEEEMANSLLLTAVEEHDEGPRYLNFSNQAAKSKPRYVPAMGTTGFWHNGNYFRVNRKKESFMNTRGWGAMKDLEEIRISCFGLSIDPIKDLLSDAKLIYYNDTRQKTSIYRPRGKEGQRDGGNWQQVARRPVRPMSTVVLDKKEKHEILRDVNEYLHPATPHWYAARGIPLRRGYLFHGPPGTGKTSFSFALAGVFGIDIYVISLQDATINEEELAVLFTRLPRRCIVLLEDIDTAGLRRPPDLEPEEPEEEETEEKDKPAVNGKSGKKKTTKKSKKETTDDSSSDDDDSSSSSSSEEDRKFRKKNKKKKRKSRQMERTLPGGKVITVETISLSGLLNAIDGVASHEGRILIMTTNKPESLDEALIRPGRVDVQVGFRNASSVQAGELFHRMYETARLQQPKVIGSSSIHTNAGAAAATEQQTRMETSRALQKLLPGSNKELDMSAEELRGIADEFGRLVASDVLSPAQIQGFLLKRKKTPRKALAEAPQWIEATIKQKEAKSKVVTVQ